MKTLELKAITAGDNEIIVSAEHMRLDEGGVDLIVCGETELSASFDGLDPFELAFRVLPEDFEVEDTFNWSGEVEKGFLRQLRDDELEMGIWLALQEYANRKELKK